MRSFLSLPFFSLSISPPSPSLSPLLLSPVRVARGSRVAAGRPAGLMRPRIHPYSREEGIDARLPVLGKQMSSETTSMMMIAFASCGCGCEDANCILVMLFFSV